MHRSERYQRQRMQHLCYVLFSIICFACLWWRKKNANVPGFNEIKWVWNQTNAAGAQTVENMSSVKAHYLNIIIFNQWKIDWEGAVPMRVVLGKAANLKSLGGRYQYAADYQYRTYWWLNAPHIANLVNLRAKKPNRNLNATSFITIITSDHKVNLQYLRALNPFVNNPTNWAPQNVTQSSILETDNCFLGATWERANRNTKCSLHNHKF